MTNLNWFEELRAKRKRWVDASEENDFERGIWNATVAKYADQTHFIFELLQNAEDEGATRATFRLGKEAVIFEHNGGDFRRKDVEGITGLGNTTKLDQANKIGCFGIGFKSVFMVTSRPEIHAAVDGAPLAFAIQDLVVPDKINWAGVNGWTRVVLPLLPAEAADIIERMRRQLRSIGPRAMLFLESLSELSWNEGSTTEIYRAASRSDGTRILTREVNGKKEGQDYLVLSRPVQHADAKGALSVKIALRLNPEGEIVRETEPCKLSVFFETEEKTGFQFHVHGPFTLTDNRANVKRDDAWNNQLILELSQLLATSLPDLRDRKLLKRGMLAVLPNLKDQLDEPWAAVREATLRAFKAEPVTPARFGGHERSITLVRGPSDLRDFLGDEGLQLFLPGGPRRWAISGAQKNDREDQFLSSLEMEEWDWADFSKALYAGLAYPKRQAVIDWLEGLDDEAVRRFYQALEASLRFTKDIRPLTTLPIVKLEDGRFVRPAAALLPPADERLGDEELSGSLSFVKSTLIWNARGRRKDTIDFLGRLGVREVSERDYIQAVVNRQRPETPGGIARHLADMRRFMGWWVEHKDTAPFKGKAFVRAEGVEGYVSADRIYIDAPFASTGLAVVYDGATEGRSRLPLWSGYNKLKREAFLGLLRMCGAEDRLIVEPVHLAWGHPLRSQFPNSRETNTAVAVDHTIVGLAGLLARQDPKIASLIWQTMMAARQATFLATYTPNQSKAARSSDSSIILTLRGSAWIPAADGTFKRPAQLTVPQLTKDFACTGNEPWLRVIGFGDEQRRNTEAGQARRNAAEAIGLPPEVADHLGRLSAEERKVAAAAFLQRLQARDLITPEFPERSSANPARRTERAAERAGLAPDKTYEVRSRSVRTSDGEVRAQAKTYLADLYTNSDGEMVCQGCQQRMPFNLPDGRPYFEAVACIADDTRELSQNHLALCPVCAAKWRFANPQTPAEVGRLLDGAPTLAVSVELAGALTTIRFVELHLLDIRAALRDEAVNHP